MKIILTLAALMTGIAAPALAQDLSAYTCAEFNALDDAGKQALAPQMKSLEVVATTEPLKSQDEAELVVSATQACSEYPTAGLGEALSQIVDRLKQKG